MYFGNRFENAQIDARDTAYMNELLGDIGTEPVDLLLETIGGQTDATDALMSLVLNRVGDFRVIVPNAAKSNGTLLCLAAKSIVVGASSELGPIDPVFGGLPCTILAEPRIAQDNFSLHMAGRYAFQQTRALASKLLTAGMMSGRQPHEIAEAIQKLCSKDVYFSHGSVINHQEATALGLVVEYLWPDDETWQRIWLLYCMYDFDARRSRYLKVFEGRARSTAIAASPPASAPAAPRP